MNNEQKRLTFEEHDQLDRERYADFLIQLAQNAESDEGSYTIAVNAEYGRGKTTLLKMMASKIDTMYSTKDKPLIVVEYNAWKYDYFDEPLIPLAMSLFKNEALEDERRYERATGKFIRASRFVASLSNGVLNHFTGIDIENACEKVKISSKEEEKFFEYDKAIDNLCDALSEAVNEYGKDGKMVVIIDELDRCRPDFAIKTLEITKHLLTNKKIVFIFALDMGQLQKTVEKAYGTGMDSTGYLLRFFNYITTIPKPCINEYISKKISKVEEQQYVEAVSRELISCYRYFQLTLRDIERIVSTYKLACDYFVKKYENYLAHMFYLHLLCMKYKKREWFENLTNDTLSIQGEFTSLYKDIGQDHGTISNRILELSRAQQVQMTIEKGVLKLVGNVNYEYRGAGKKFKDIHIFYNNNKLVVEPEPVTIEMGIRSKLVSSITDDTIIGFALFTEDLEHFESFRARSIPEYIHQQMEFFNFETGLVEDKNNVVNEENRSM